MRVRLVYPILPYGRRSDAFSAGWISEGVIPFSNTFIFISFDFVDRAIVKLSEVVCRTFRRHIIVRIYNTKFKY